jgi:hypothetical protein
LESVGRVLLGGEVLAKSGGGDESVDVVVVCGQDLGEDSVDVSGVGYIGFVRCDDGELVGVGVLGFPLF